VGCSSFIFFLSFKKINVLLVRWLTKTMTKKWRATAQSSPPLGLLAVPLRRGFGMLSGKMILF
jgi:hypothetical protein